MKTRAPIYIALLLVAGLVSPCDRDDAVDPGVGNQLPTPPEECKLASTRLPSLRGIDFRDSKTGIAVGLGTMRTEDGGITWEERKAPVPSYLFDVQFSDAVTAHAVGSAGTILRTADAGETWTSVSSGTTRSLNGVWFAGPSDGVTVGDNVVLWTNDGGTSWLPVSLPDGDLDLLDVVMMNPLSAIAVGEIILERRTGVILSTTDGGANWVQTEFPNLDGVTGVAFTDRINGIALGERTLLRTSDGGRTWSMESSLPGLRHVAFADSLTGVAFGGWGKVCWSWNGGRTWWPVERFQYFYTVHSIAFVTSTMAVAVGQKNYSEDGDIPPRHDPFLMRTTDWGQTWRHHAALPENLRGACFTDALTGTVVGRAGAIARTTDGGTTWTAQYPTTRDLLGVSFANDATGIAVGDRGTALRTTDGGSSWVAGASWTAENLEAVQMVSVGTAFAVGGSGTILKTADGGQTWASQATPANENFLGVAFYDEMSGMVVGEGGVILHTTDGGATWQSLDGQTSNDLYDICAPGVLDWVAVGARTIVRTSDGGDTWSSQTLPSSRHLRSVTIGSASSGIAVGLGGVSYRTVDGGVTWTEESTPVFSFLYDASFADVFTVVGSLGTILRCE